jgi:hypothetical protein
VDWTGINRRIKGTRFFVPDPSFGWYVRGVGVGTLLASLFFGGLLWWYHGRLLDLLGLYDLLREPGMQDVMARYARLSLLVTVVAVLGVATFVMLLSIFFLHRIAGPVYRMKVHMMAIMAGESPGPLRFRKDDQLKDLSDIFNEFLEHQGLAQRRSSGAAATEPAAEEPARAPVGSTV